MIRNTACINLCRTCFSKKKPSQTSPFVCLAYRIKTDNKTITAGEPVTPKCSIVSTKPSQTKDLSLVLFEFINRNVLTFNMQEWDLLWIHGTIILYTFFQETVHKHGGGKGKYKNLKMTLRWALTWAEWETLTFFFFFFKLKMFFFFFPYIKKHCYYQGNKT